MTADKEPGIPSPKTRTITMRLPVTLTDREFDERARALAACEDELHAEEDSQDSIKAGLKAKLADISKRRTLLAGIVTRNEEMRDVECEELFDFGPAQVIRTRKDTGEEILRRPMTDEERQRGLFGEI